MEENRTEKQDVTEAAATETEIKETAVETENKTEQVSETAAPEKPETEPAEKGKTAKKSGPVKKWIKICLKVLLGIVLFLVIAISCFLLFLDSIMKGIIEGYGPEYAGVIFEIEDIDVQLLKGRIEIKNLCMYNPEGYKTDYAVKLGDVAFQTDIMSWIGDGKAIIREVRLRDIDINYETEFPLSTDSNLNDILQNLQNIAGQQQAAEEAAETEPPAEETAVEEEAAAEAETPAETPAEEAEPKRLQIDKVIIENVRLAVVPKGHPNFSVPLILTLPELGPAGTEPEGLTGPEIAADMAGQVLTGIVKCVSDSAKEIYKSLSTQGMNLAGNVVEGAQNMVDGIKKSSDDAVESLKKTGENIKQIGDDAKKVWDSLRGK